MPISTNHSGAWKKSDLLACGVAVDAEGRTTATGQLYVESPIPVFVQVPIPKKAYAKVSRILAPYLLSQAVTQYPGSTKSPGVGVPDPSDQD